MRLLVVEDDPMVRHVIVLTASRHGIQVDAAADGEQAASMVGKRRYDVVITDLRMPGMSGLELMEGLQRLCPETALILVTGFAQDDDEERVARAGGLLLHKPFNQKRLLGALRWAKERADKPSG